MKRTWKGLTATQQRAVVLGGAAELTLTAFAFIDLTRRPRTTVRGPRLAWVLACLVQPFGPIAYLLFGRRIPWARR